MPKNASQSWPEVTDLAQEHDCLLIDLDGPWSRGTDPPPGAVETLAKIGSRVLFVTNNASRGPAEVAEHLREMGFSAEPDDIVTSAQSAAHLLAAQLPPGSPVLIVGTESLAAEVRGVGVKPVRLWSDEPVAVVQGHSTQTGGRAVAGAGAREVAGRGGGGPPDADRLHRPRRSGARHPWRRAVGGGQRRSHTALRA